jgi:hypothetical protein
MWLNDDGTGGRNGFSKVVSKKRFWEPKKDQTIKRSNMDYGSHYRFQHMFEKTFEFTAQGKADADFVARHLPNTLVGNGGEGKPVTAFQWDGYLVFFDPKDNLIFWCRPAK